jgi:quinol monooxygenase YgiN
MAAQSTSGDSEDTMSERVMIATIVTHPGKRDDLKKVFAEMFPVASKEEGTLLYTLIEGDQPDTLYFYEHYRDQDAMNSHLGGEVLTALRGKMGALIASGDAVTGTVAQKIR